MIYTVSITSQGQISIPAKFRRKYGLEKNGKIILSEEENKLIMEPAEDLLELRGSLKTTKRIPFKKIRQGFEEYLAKEAVKGME